MFYICVSQSEVVQQELKTSTVVLQTSSMELKDSHQSLRNLELELQAIIAMVITKAK